MYQIKNFQDNDDVRTLDQLGPFTVIEYLRDLSVTPGSAMTAYYCNEMNVRKRQVLCDLAQADITVQAGAMQWMVGDVKATTGVKGVGDLLGKAIRGKATGESAIKPEYTGSGTLVLEPTYKHLILMDAAEWNGSVVLDDGLFLACDSRLQHKAVMRSNFSSAVAGGEGLFNLSLNGSGVFCIESDCPKEELVETLMGTTPLKQISKRIDVKWEDPVVPRYNGQRSQRVQCSPVPGVETEKARQSIATQIEQIPLPDGYRLQWQGERNASTKSMQYLFKNFPFAIILMISILIMLFKDYRKPVIIFCTIPLVFVGVVAVMLLTGKTFNFVAIVGTLGLIGMIIKNGIVLMDEITLQINQGVEPVTALIDSSQSRLRPVMMASLTTILGMIPLLPDAMFGSLAASIMGGLLFGTLITLLFIPILYALFFHIKKTDK